MHGLLNLDKPAGMSSRDAVNHVSRLLRKVKVGHAGTLDPLATGVLVVCVGAATRLVERVQEYRKGYRAGLKLGVRSDTDDSTGTVIPGSDPAAITAADIQEFLADFQGHITQIPPKFSAVHVDGQRAYALARTETPFELSAREVHVESIRLSRHVVNEAELEIVCGSGTYIRSIIRDLGDRLGCGAIMTSLRRTFIGPFQETDSWPVDQISQETLAAHLLPLNSVLESEPRFPATQAECQAFLQGKAVPVTAKFPCSAPGQVAVLDPTGELFAFANLDAERRLLFPSRVFVR